jgi:hypothetical protein
MKPISRTVALLLTASFLLLNTPGLKADAMDDEHRFTASTVDLLIARPFGLATTLLGTALFLVSLPVTAITKNTQTAADTLVEPPFNFTFRRKLGDF